MKNFLNSMRKRGGKTGDLINEKPPKLNEKMRKKIIRCTQLSSSKRYAEKKLKDLYIGEKPSREKIKGSTNKKPSKLDEKTRRKTDHFIAACKS